MPLTREQMQELGNRLEQTWFPKRGRRSVSEWNYWEIGVLVHGWPSSRKSNDWKSEANGHAVEDGSLLRKSSPSGMASASGLSRTE
jgi:hypothetical protein